jgi:uncharacterized membrane protein YfcA
LLLTAALLCLFALAAGFVDAVAGGGGLIQVPALLALLPGLPIATLFGTNKLASLFGTGTAATWYARHIEIPWRTALPAALAALAGSWAGARMVRLLDPALLRPVVLAMLVAVAVFTIVRPEYGRRRVRPRARGAARLPLAILVGGVLGFYDGFFGPGAGTFLIFAFIGLFGLDFLSASATAKVVNFGSAVAALGYFAATGNVRWGLGLAMAASLTVGATLGARLAVRGGVRLVRPFFLGVVTALIARIAWTTLRG